MSAAGPTILLTAIEASGDALGAALMRALRRRLGSEVRFVGVGGPEMAAEGLDSLFDPHELAVVGAWEGVKVWSRVRHGVRVLVEMALRERPDLAVLIDSWGFSIRAGKSLKAALPRLVLVKYVSPQVWATRPGRAKQIAAVFDHLLSILPMDAPHYAGLPITSTFVGHPVLAGEPPPSDAAGLRHELGISPDAPILLVLPGSRSGEIRRMLPVFTDTAARLKASRPSLQIVMPLAPAVAAQVQAAARNWPFEAHLLTDPARKADAMAASTVALACSGTVTSELAMAGCPMVVAYRVSPLTAAVIRRIIKVRFATLFNIAADRPVAPEYIQDACTAENLSGAIAERLDDPALRQRQAAEQFAALALLGRGGADPAEASADEIVRLLAISHPAGDGPAELGETL